MNYYDIDEQIREDASYDDSFAPSNQQRHLRELRALRGKKLPVVAVYPDKVEVKGAQR